jgi:hypothetical protein
VATLRLRQVYACDCTRPHNQSLRLVRRHVHVTCRHAQRNWSLHTRSLWNSRRYILAVCTASPIRTREVEKICQDRQAELTLLGPWAGARLRVVGSRAPRQRAAAAPRPAAPPSSRPHTYAPLPPVRALVQWCFTHRSCDTSKVNNAAHYTSLFTSPHAACGFIKIVLSGPNKQQSRKEIVGPGAAYPSS